MDVDLKVELYKLLRSDAGVFDFLQNSLLDGMWYRDLENPEDEWMNDRFWTVLGYNPDEMPQKSSAWQNIINRDDLQLANENFFKHCADPNHPYDQIVRYTHKNGSTRWIRCRGMAIRDKEGKPIRMLGVHQDVTELIEREQELVLAKKKIQHSEERYAAFYNNAPLSFQSLDEDGCFIDVNPKWLQTLGYDRDEVIGKWYGDFLHPDSVDHFRTNFPAFKKRGNVSDVQFALRKKDNTYIHVSFEGSVGYTPDGKFRQTYCVFKDISEQKALEKALIKAKETAERNEAEQRTLSENLKQERILLRTIVDSIPDAIYVKDLSSRKVLANKADCQNCGVEKEEELLGKDDFAVYPPEFAERFLADDQKVMTEGISVLDREERLKAPDGSDKWYLSSKVPLYDDAGNIVGLAGNARDITTRKLAEEKLKLLNRAIEASSVSVVVTDAEGMINYVNPYFTELTLYSPDEVLGQKLQVLRCGALSEVDCKGLWNAIRSGQDWTGEYRNTKKNGEFYWEKSVISPIMSSSGELTHLVSISEDMTERKKMVEELVDAKEKAEESDRLKSAFLANMSHEIRTPMNGILGFAELLKEPDLSGELQHKYLQIIQKSGARMLSIINDIISISKIESGIIDIHLEETNINQQLQFVYDVLRLDADRKQLNFLFHCDLSDSEAVLQTDSEKLYGILTNLVKNAIKFTDAGTIEFGYTAKEKEIEFYVKDTGVGIPKEKQQHIFERFIQADIADTMARQGAGLGLSISRAYVAMLGGKIRVESEEGRGSTFYFSLPCHTRPVAETMNRQSASSAESDTVRKLNILIAEDDEVSEILLTRFIKKFGKQIYRASNGIEAVATCRAHPEIDVIMMDIRMPEMDGYEATRQIRAFNSEVVIIAQTAHAQAGDREKALAAGCTDYIAKPINRNELHALIERYFGK